MKKILIVVIVIAALFGGRHVLLQGQKTQANAAVVPSARPVPTEAPELDQINAVRARVGRAPLVRDGRLDAAAKLKTEDMIHRHYLTHHLPGETPWQFFDTQVGSYSASAENLAWCQRTVTQRVKEWVASPSHYEAMIGNYSLWGSDTETDPVTHCQVTTNYFLAP